MHGFVPAYISTLLAYGAANRFSQKPREDKTASATKINYYNLMGALLIAPIYFRQWQLIKLV